MRLAVAGRTDRGVHAWGQVASYEGDPVPLDGLNAVLANDVSAVSIEKAPPGFHARHDARSRTYCYRVLARRGRSALHAGRALWWPHRLERAALRECAAALAGTHDFTAFTRTDTSHARFHRHVLRAEWLEDGDLLEFWIEADAFMRHMNRVLVGTMLEVAGGRRTVDDLAGLLAGASRDEAGPTAPAHGLYLAAVSYDPRRPAGRDRRQPRLSSDES